MGVSWNLTERCLTMIAREMTRPMVRGTTPQERHDHWMSLHKDPDIKAAARMKLEALSNLELLDLIGEALANDG